MTREDATKLALTANIIGAAEIMEQFTRPHTRQHSQIQRLLEVAHRILDTIPGDPPADMIERSTEYYTTMEQATERLLAHGN